jgi:hypothetical protein
MASVSFVRHPPRKRSITGLPSVRDTMLRRFGADRDESAMASGGRKMFFFEKKNQKTFVTLSRTRRPARANRQKFFGSFFQKRTLPSLLF